MEKNLTAMFKRVDDLEQAADALRKQGVLELRFDETVPIKVDYQSDTLIQSMENALQSSDQAYALQVSVEKSRYRQAEDTIAKFGGQL